MVLLQQSFSRLGKQNKFRYGEVPFGFARRFDSRQTKLWGDLGGPNSPSQTPLSRKIVSCLAKDRRCNWRLPNGKRQRGASKFGWVLLGVEASKTDVQLLSKALIFELCKIVDSLSKRCEYHGTCGSPKKGGTNYSEGPSKRFNILLYCFAFRTNTEILKPDRLQNGQYLEGDASTEGDECVTSY